MKNSKVIEVLQLLQEESAITNRIKELKSLLKTKSIKITLWSGSGGISNCSQFINQVELKKEIKKEIDKLIIDLPKIKEKLNTFKDNK